VKRLKKPSGVVLRRLSRIKRVSLNFCRKHFLKGDSIHFLVIYKPNIHNEGIYTEWSEFNKAWEAFTEESLIKEALTYNE
jgi:hypothetical protein